ncbi:MAG: FAD binding domain-containing protein, partial [bacterium]
SLHRIRDLAGVAANDEGGLSLGAMTTLRALETDPGVMKDYPLLAETLSQVANVRVRGAATLGGNLAHGDYRLDPPGALIALGARLRLGSPRGVRTLPLADFFLGFFETDKAEDEIILGADLPPPDPAASGHYLKFTSHASSDWPCVGVAAHLRWDGAGRCAGAEVVVTAAAATPLRVAGMADLLKGEALTEALARRAGELAAGQLEPIEDASGSAWYKREIAPVLVRRALLEAARRAPAARGATGRSRG